MFDQSSSAKSVFVAHGDAIRAVPSYEGSGRASVQYLLLMPDEIARIK